MSEIEENIFKLCQSTNNYWNLQTNIIFSHLSPSLSMSYSSAAVKSSSLDLYSTGLRVSTNFVWRTAPLDNGSNLSPFVVQPCCQYTGWRDQENGLFSILPPGRSSVALRGWGHLHYRYITLSVWRTIPITSSMSENLDLPSKPQVNSLRPATKSSGRPQIFQTWQLIPALTWLA